MIFYSYLLKTSSIFIGSFILFSACNSSIADEKKNYFESEPSFFELRNEDWLTNNWIRKPENLLTIHETFKKVDYNNIFGSILSDNPIIIQDIYIKKSVYHLIDSLVLTYNQRDLGTLYYKEFWARREVEKNDSAIFVILKDIQYLIKTENNSAGSQLPVDNAMINDTLQMLLEIEYREDSLTTELALKDFERLRDLGFHQSAYNLLYNYYKYQNLNWKKDSLEMTLKKSNIVKKPWFQDDIK